MSELATSSRGSQGLRPKSCPEREQATPTNLSITSARCGRFRTPRLGETVILFCLLTNGHTASLVTLPASAHDFSERGHDLREG